MRLALFGHSLAQKATLVRIGDTVEENIEELRELEISLHGKTMQLQAVMNGQTLLSLIDSGSTHNFISVTVAQRLAIPVTPSVSIANGEKVKSRGICSRLLFYIATSGLYSPSDSDCNGAEGRSATRYSQPGTTDGGTHGEKVHALDSDARAESGSTVAAPTKP